MFSDDEPALLGSLYDADDVWDEYEGQDQDVRRVRWIAMAAGWVLGQDKLVRKLLAQLPLAELIDIDSSLTTWRHEVRQAISALEGPLTKVPRRQPGDD